MKMVFGGEPPDDSTDCPLVDETVGLRCAEPNCNGELRRRWSPKTASWFYGCKRFTAGCRGVLPANRDGSPRGMPRTRELQGLRNACHKLFDAGWQSGVVLEGELLPRRRSRSIAYKWLAEVMSVPREEAHFFMFNEQECERALTILKEKGPGTQSWMDWLATQHLRKKVKPDLGEADND